MRGAVPERRQRRRRGVVLGRSPALWLAIVTAALNCAVVVLGVQLTAEQLAAINALAIAVLGIVANESDPTTVPTFAPTLRDRRSMSTEAIQARLRGIVPVPGGRRATDRPDPDPDPMMGP